MTPNIFSHYFPLGMDSELSLHVLSKVNGETPLNIKMRFVSGAFYFRRVHLACRPRFLQVADDLVASRHIDGLDSTPAGNDD